MRNPREAIAWLVTGTGLLVFVLSLGLLVFARVFPSTDSPDAGGMLVGVAISALLLLALPLLVLGGLLFGLSERDNKLE